MRRLRPLSGSVALALLLAGRALAQDPGPALPRVIYGSPSPNVIYGEPSAPPPAPERRPPAQAPSPPAAEGTLSYESGPAYLPPAYWWPPPFDGHRPPHGAVRPPPRMPTPYVSPEGGRYEPPLPQGRYVGRPPSAPPPTPRYGRPPGG